MLLHRGFVQVKIVIIITRFLAFHETVLRLTDAVVRRRNRSQRVIALAALQRAGAPGFLAGHVKSVSLQFRTNAFNHTASATPRYYTVRGALESLFRAFAPTLSTLWWKEPTEFRSCPV